MQQKEVERRRSRTPEQALAALQRLCARAEKSSGDALRLMRTWGVDEPARAGVLSQLVAQRFIDDRRFADAFVREKLRLSGWGLFKIRAALLRKGIDRTTIEEALRQADASSMSERLRTLLLRKSRTVGYASLYGLRSKLMRYGLSLGYDFESVADAVAELVKENGPCDDTF